MGVKYKTFAMGVILSLFLGVGQVKAQVMNTGNIFYLGDDIAVAVTAANGGINYSLEFVLNDKDGSSPVTNSLVSEVFSGTGTVVNNVAYLPTSMLVKKGVYMLSGTGISRRRIILVDPVPTVPDLLKWRFGLIVSSDKLDQGAAMADELYRLGIKYFHFDYSIGNVNSIGSSSDPAAGRISVGYEAFITRAAELGIYPVFKLMNHYSQISGPTNLNGNFYNGLRKIQTYYKGKLKYWTVSNEPEGGGYSQFTPQELADTVKNMSIVLKGVDPQVKIIAAEFYGVPNQHTSLLTSPAYKDYWDIMSGHNMVRIDGGNSGISDYIQALGGVQKPVWDTESNGTMFGNPAEDGNYMASIFPISLDTSGDSSRNVWGGVNKQMIRTLCLETQNGTNWVAGFYNPTVPCIGADLYIAMHYNANWEIIWGLKTLRTTSQDYQNVLNQKIVGFRTAVDTLYSATGVTRIPNLACGDPYNGCSPTANYTASDGYIYKNGAEYEVMLWQNMGDDANDREVVLTTNPGDKIVLYNSQGKIIPLQNNSGQVKVWVPMDMVYLRGFTKIPVFSLETTGGDKPYFATTPVVKAASGKPYYYNVWAYDSDKPNSQTGNSLPRINYQLVSGPSGMALSTTANGDALVYWANPVAGSHSVTLRATSTHGSSQSVDQTFTLVVSTANVAPQILSQPVSTFARSGYTWWYNVNAWDANGDKVTYALGQSPAGMTIDPNSGFIQWVPTGATSSSVRVSAIDGAGLLGEQTFTVTSDGAIPAGKPGDANSDNNVDGLDYVIWLTNYNLPGGGIGRGDFNSDGKTDGLDYVIWLNNYGS